MKKIVILLTLSIFTLACKNNEVVEKPEKVKMSVQDSARIAKEIENFSPENHVNSMEMVFGKPKFNIKTIGILVYDGVNDLDLMGPRYVLGQAMGVKTQLISIKKGTIKTVMGVEIVPNTTIDAINQLDILIIPGGFKGTIEAAYN